MFNCLEALIFGEGYQTITEHESLKTDVEDMTPLARDTDT